MSQPLGMPVPPHGARRPGHLVWVPCPGCLSLERQLTPPLPHSPLMLNDSSSAHSMPKYSRQYSLEHIHGPVPYSVSTSCNTTGLHGRCQGAHRMRPLPFDGRLRPRPMVAPACTPQMPSPTLVLSSPTSLSWLPAAP